MLRGWGIGIYDLVMWVRVSENTLINYLLVMPGTIHFKGIRQNKK